MKIPDKMAQTFMTPLKIKGGASAENSDIIFINLTYTCIFVQGGMEFKLVLTAQSIAFIQQVFIKQIQDIAETEWQNHETLTKKKLQARDFLLTCLSKVQGNPQLLRDFYQLCKEHVAYTQRLITCATDTLREVNNQSIQGTGGPSELEQKHQALTNCVVVLNIRLRQFQLCEDYFDILIQDIAPQEWEETAEPFILLSYIEYLQALNFKALGVHIDQFLTLFEVQGETFFQPHHRNEKPLSYLKQTFIHRLEKYSPTNRASTTPAFSREREQFQQYLTQIVNDSTDNDTDIDEDELQAEETDLKNKSLNI